MQGCRAGCLGLLLCLLAGCATRGAQTANSSWYQRFQPLSVAEERKGQIEIALVQAPTEEDVKAVPNIAGVQLASWTQMAGTAGEKYLADGIWGDVDEQVLPIEARPKLEENGFRVGIIRNTLPGKLQQLLAAPTSSGQMRRLIAKADHEWFWPLGTRPGATSLTITQEGKPDKRELEQAEFGILIKALSLPESKTRLVMTPILRHGTQMFHAKPNKDHTGWEYNAERPEERFAKLSWEVVLKPNEYLVVGGWPTKPDSLGRHSFTEAESGHHRVLVLRGVPVAEPLTMSGDGKGPLPLALQSLMPSKQDARRPPKEVRGQSP
jgi:hypothetical protein